MTNLMNRQLNRRTALIGGGAALGAIGAAALTGAAHADPLLPVTASPMISAPLVGATFDLVPFPAGTTYDQAVDIWNTTTGTTMHCWKVYFGDSKFPNMIDEQIQTIIKRNIQALLCFKPSPAQSPADLAALDATLRMYSGAQLNAEVTLWQEVGPKDMTATDYAGVVSYYGPTVRRYYPLVYNAPGYLGPGEWKTYDPGWPNLDGYAVDFYCGDYINKGYRLDMIAELAGPLPIGIWEIGNTASDNFFPTDAQLSEFFGYITGFLTGRAASGGAIGSSAWFNGPATAGQSGLNEIAGTDPNPLAARDIALYQKFYTDIDAG